MIATTQEELESTAYHHFKDFYKGSASDIMAQVEVAQGLPRYFSDTEARDLDAPVTSDEIKVVLAHMAADKSPGPDGWPVEFFQTFYHLLGNEILQMVEDSRI